MIVDAKARSASYFDLHHASRLAREGYWNFDYKRSIQALELLRPATLIDIGCGPGGFLAKVQRQIPQVQLSAMDLSAGMIDEVAQRFGDSVDAFVGDAEHMPIPTDTYDAVTVNMSVHHWPHPQAGIDEVFRILRPGGHLLLNDMDCILPIRALANVVFPHLPAGDVKMYKQQEIRAMLSKAGFDILSYHKITPWTFLCVAEKPQVEEEVHL